MTAWCLCWKKETVLSERPRPTREAVAAAYGRTIPDVIGPGLKVLFCGINPSLYSAAVGHHFARPGNRFWPALQAGGFTGRVLLPSEGSELLALGYGIVNIVDRATGAADELSTEELVEGARRLEAKVRHYRPAAVTFLGITAYRTAFGRRRARPGPQAETIAEAGVWVLPNPSGRCVSFAVAGYRELFFEVSRAPPPGGGA
jgi:TDG/mug DNA glycosylase family protein